MEEVKRKKAAQALNLLFISMTLQVVLTVFRASGLLGLITVILLLVGLQRLCNQVDKRFVPAWNLVMLEFGLEILIFLALGLISSRAAEAAWAAPAVVGLLFGVALVGPVLSCLYMRIICLRTADLLNECGSTDIAALAPQAIKIYWFSVAVSVVCTLLSLVAGSIPELIGTIASVLGQLVLAVFFQKSGQNLGG